MDASALDGVIARLRAAVDTPPTLPALRFTPGVRTVQTDLMLRQAIRLATAQVAAQAVRQLAG